MKSDKIIGALWMVVTTICFSLTLTFVRYIGTDMPATQAAFIRYLAGAIMLAPFWVPVVPIINHRKKPNGRGSEDKKKKSRVLYFKGRYS